MRYQCLVKALSTSSGAALKKEDVEGTLKSAIGVVFLKNRVLLGKAKTNDDRNGLWCFPGGGIESGEDVIDAALREVKEETGIVAAYRRNAKIIKNDLIFVGMDFISGKTTHNFEFTDMQWFPINDLPEDIYPNNEQILKEICLL